MTHIMLDIETLGLKPGCVVLSVAMVRFSDLASMSIVLDRPTQCAAGLIENQQTIDWWGRQSVAARAAVFNNPNDTRTALAYIEQWLAWANCEFIWCHGVGFDAPILAEVFERFGMQCPWKYWQIRDTRTLFDLAGVSLYDFFDGERHIALNDAECQTRAAIKALGILASRYAETLK